MPKARIHCVDAPALVAARAEELREALLCVLESGCYVLGPEVEALEKEFSLWLNKPVAGLTITPPLSLGVCSGTAGLELALRGFFSLNADVAPFNQGGHSDQAAVFAPAHASASTLIAIERAGAVPVLVDIDPQTLTLSPSSLAAAVDTARLAGLTPAAAVAVHAHGHPCHMRLLELISQDAGLWILEDCAEAHGALYEGRMVGTLAEAAAFSCHPGRNLAALGDAGLVCTAFSPLADEMFILRQYGCKDCRIAALPGVNARMAEVQAAVLRVNLRYLDEDLATRRAQAARYLEALPKAKVQLPHCAAWAKHAWHHFVVRVPTPQGQPSRRDDLLLHLQRAGIDAATHAPQPLHLQPAYKDRLLTAPDKLPETVALYDQLLTLPLYPTMTEDEQALVVETVQSWQG